MRWLLFFAVLLISAAAFALGLWLGRKAREEERMKLAYTPVAIGLVFVLTRAFFRFFPLAEFAAFPFDAYAVLRPWWAIPPAMLLLGVGSMQMSTERARKLVAVFSLCVLLVCVQRLWITARFDPATVVGVVSPATGVCEQTTGYTCGAAAASTLLHHYGVETSEREMAERCWTNGLTGTDAFCVARGLRQKTQGQGKVVRIDLLDWERLIARKEPTAVTIQWGVLVDHWVVVLESSPDKVLVGDPLHGLQHYRKDEFLAKWRRLSVFLEPGS